MCWLPDRGEINRNTLQDFDTPLIGAVSQRKDVVERGARMLYLSGDSQMSTPCVVQCEGTACSSNLYTPSCDVGLRKASLSSGKALGSAPNSSSDVVMFLEALFDRHELRVSDMMGAEVSRGGTKHVPCQSFRSKPLNTVLFLALCRVSSLQVDFPKLSRNLIQGAGKTLRKLDARRRNNLFRNRCTSSFSDSCNTPATSLLQVFWTSRNTLFNKKQLFPWF